MKAIVCIDENGGMMFNGRRVSRDVKIAEMIANDLGGGVLWMREKSVGFFEKVTLPMNLRTDESFFEKAAPEESCFFEDVDPATCVDAISEITVYCWGRRYPADVKCTLALTPGGAWKRCSTAVFAGNSHEKITKEVWSK